MAVCIEVDDEADDSERGCFYCGGVVPEGWRQTERDHFPVPRRAGGVDTVLACYTCHHMKDRKRLMDWPIEWVGCVLEDIAKFGDGELLTFLAKAAQAMMRANHADDTKFAALAERSGIRLHEWPLDWQTRVVETFPKLKRETRIFVAKVMAQSHDVAVRMALPVRGIKLATAILASSMGTSRVGTAIVTGSLGTSFGIASATAGFPVVTSVASQMFLLGLAPQCRTSTVN